MCNLYRLSTPGQAVRSWFRVVGGPDEGWSADVYPGRLAPVVVADAAGRGLRLMRWGIPPPAGLAKPVTNVRNLSSPFWRPLLGKDRRCLVPASAFAEWSRAPDPATGRKRRHWVALRSSALFAFAGLWWPGPDGPRFAFLTCPANAVVAEVHPQAMPVILGEGDGEAWLLGAEARAFQRPWPADDMVRLPDGLTR
ncbi:MAG: SOS response-associated peptidase [Sphingomonadaceae bacterium]|uniref:SOS response-associated peptidase n=1 Tax=Thermaurantiacus sp. TaxID=2820283 RepID=UPI00298F2A82|nr:SOS response-associated peptidase family protein [Thermaurantiacus sp.]MCS6987303.1 SOS response-associated peptidase [Sphingomonadaceae bacterium]MDW8414523.1 SOS response-associated peptidase family protein [Thermaurantiacus sp.]